MAKKFIPSILTANDLVKGDVVFLTGAGWARDHHTAVIARTSEAAAALKARGDAAHAANLVIDPYLIEVEIAAAGPRPILRRERIRTLGPSIRLDLGKQAARAA